MSEIIDNLVAYTQGDTPATPRPARSIAIRPTYGECCAYALELSESIIKMPNKQAWVQLGILLAESRLPADLQQGIKAMAWLHRRLHVLNAKPARLTKVEKKAQWASMLNAELERQGWTQTKPRSEWLDRKSRREAESAIEPSLVALVKSAPLVT